MCYITLAMQAHMHEQKQYFYNYRNNLANAMTTNNGAALNIR